jgi:hypothetical protein
VADAVGIVLFTVIGLISHQASAAAFAHDALPLLGGWFAVALATRLYQRASLWRLLVTWAVGITAGVLVRALILGRHLGRHEAAFLAVALVFIGLWVVLTRAVAAVRTSRR